MTFFGPCYNRTGHSGATGNKLSQHHSPARSWDLEKGTASGGSQWAQPTPLLKDWRKPSYALVNGFSDQHFPTLQAFNKDWTGLNGTEQTWINVTQSILGVLSRTGNQPSPPQALCKGLPLPKAPELSKSIEHINKSHWVINSCCEDARGWMRCQQFFSQLIVNHKGRQGRLAQAAWPGRVGNVGRVAGRGRHVWAQGC